jgi:DNA repair protein RecN (Recombination protein N)
MIKYLRINDIALVDRLEIELRAGLVLLTGETGAGKSILIDALALVLGERADVDALREGADRASVEAIFEAPGAHAWLEEHGLPVEEEGILLRREIGRSGRSRAWVNGALVPASLQRELGRRLVTIHGQHDSHDLFEPSTHRELLDIHASLKPLAREVAELHARLGSVRAELDRLRAERRDRERRREMLEFQSGEIDRAALRDGEEEELRREKVLQLNAGRIAALASEAYSLLYDAEGAALVRLRQAYRRIEELAALDPALRPHLDGSGAVLAAVEDAALSLRDHVDPAESDPDRLEEIEGRLSVIERLKRKYGATVAEVLEFGATCRKELEQLQGAEGREEELAQEREGLATAYLDQAGALSRARRAAAAALQARVEQELGQLAMDKTRFRVAFQPDSVSTDVPEHHWHEHGLDEVAFQIAPNPGEPMRPLARIASGGELSRLLLALKSAAIQADTERALVFDEIDAGVGGRVAEVVGRKLRALSRGRQVLCITHLGPIAALADQHLVVEKVTVEGRTRTLVREVDGAGRVDEIARMLGGDSGGGAARRHAEELLSAMERA